MKLNNQVQSVALVVLGLTLTSCMNHDMNMNTYVNVTEGDFSTPLLIPTEVNGITTITAQNTSANIINGNPTSVFGYGNGILGPTIRVQSGATTNINFSNQLNDATNIHWHGLIVPSNMDGLPTDVVQPSSSFNYTFPINQRAGTYWYHPHTDHLTSYQVFMGLAGFFIVNDLEEQNLNLPSGNQEIPLVIQDKRMNLGYNLDYSPSCAEVMNGYLGQYVIVNGVHSPFQNVETRYYRFRVLNGSTARIYNLALSNGASFTVIGADGGLLSVPESVTSLLLAPGERADILIDFSSYPLGTELFLQSNSFAGVSSQGNETFKILKLVVNANASDPFIIPSTLSSIMPIAPSATTKTFDIGSMMMDGMNGMGGMNDDPCTNMNIHTINDLTYDANRIDATVSAGTTEIWEFDNSNSDETHPIHIHGVQFQVMERTGGRGALIATEKGWKDTILLLPGEKVKVIMVFPTYTGKFVLHCHNLEHEDDGMMLNYLIQ